MTAVEQQVTPAALCRRITALCEDVFRPLEQLRRTCVAAIFAAGGRPALADLAGLERLVIGELNRPGSLVVGSGLVAAPDLIQDAPWHLAWWSRDRTGTVSPLDVVSDPAQDGFRDYTVLEWWTEPERTGQRHITGPYVDYLCTDDYTLTFTVPVLVDGVMHGVVGSDVYVARAEQLILPLLRALPSPATLINSTGRVVVSAQLRRPTGSLVRSPEAHQPALDCPDVPLRLLLNDLG
jgi:methyl-accepting chemotaxis protein-like sensor